MGDVLERLGVCVGECAQGCRCRFGRDLQLGHHHAGGPVDLRALLIGVAQSRL